MSRVGLIGRFGFGIDSGLIVAQMLWARVRRASAVYFALFFLAVASAPHHHLNGIEDLLLDQRSDSGLIAQTLGPPGTRQKPALNAIRFARDFPCLACFGGDFVSITAAPGVDWGLLKPQVVAVLLDHFVSQAPLFAGGDASGISVPPEAEGDIGDDPADAEIVEQIKELIETRVRPAVANDGGDIRYRGYRAGIVYLAMQGACSGCPSSTATLKQGIEGLLKHYVPEVTEVRAA